MPAFYRSNMKDLRLTTPDHIVGSLTAGAAGMGFSTQQHQQTQAWQVQVSLLQATVKDLSAQLPQCLGWEVLWEYPIPLRQKRLDAVVLAEDLIFVIEFKIGSASFGRADRLQVEDYCLDLRDFHSESQAHTIVPVLCASQAMDVPSECPVDLTDPVQEVRCVSPTQLAATLHDAFIRWHDPEAPTVDAAAWDGSDYRPVPSILRATEALYAEHSVRDISRAHVGNLTATTDKLLTTIQEARDSGQKVICFVTGIPGAGKTLAGLNLASRP